MNHPTLSPVRCPVCRKLIVEQLIGGAIRFTCPRPRCGKRFEIQADGTIRPLT